MNAALTYLWFTLLKRRTFHLLRCLKKPATLIGFVGLVFLIGILFRFRHEQGFAQLVRPESLIGGALLMLGGALFKGFLQRGLVFEPPDIQFLFTSPFTEKQIIFYRQLSGYFFAVAQSIVFYALFEVHLKHPVLVAIGLILFQIVCFHIAAGAAIFAGTISEQAHDRARWMFLCVYFVIAALYLRVAWGLKLVPSFLSSTVIQAFFYPASTMTNLASTPLLRDWSLRLVKSNPSALSIYWQPAIYLVTLGFSAFVSLGLVLRLKANIFETSLATTTHVAEKRLKVRQGRTLTFVEDGQIPSIAMPGTSLFHGVGAIIWKNLVVASRSKREIMLAAAFTFIYTSFLIALRVVLHRLIAEGGQLPARDLRDFDNGLAFMLVGLTFFLQRSFPFDFRRDGHHLVGFRTLPVSPLALALAQISVPTLFCLAFQAVAVLGLMLCGRFEWSLLLVMLLGFPAVALGLNAVWNLHYLLAATKRAGGKAESASSVTVLMVVALSFFIFYPAGWAAVEIGRRTPAAWCEPVGFIVWLAVQYSIDFCLLLSLAKLFQRFEVSDDVR